jgi:hypothetical protein
MFEYTEGAVDIQGGGDLSQGWRIAVSVDMPIDAVEHLLLAICDRSHLNPLNGYQKATYHLRTFFVKWSG